MMVAFTGTDLPASGQFIIPGNPLLGLVVTELDQAKALRSPLQSAGDTGAILSYYKSAAANGAMSDASLASSSGPSSIFVSPTAFHSRSISSTSIGTQSSSAYSSESSKARATAPSAYKPPQPRPASPLGLNGAARRSSIPSEGGADRRRIAVVEMDMHVNEHPRSDTYRDTSTSPSSNLGSRRGSEAQLGGLALVAPPDASLRTCIGFTHPLTSPVQPPSIQLQPSSSTAPSHVRSSSETVTVSGRVMGHTRKSSREVAVLGTLSRPTKLSDQDYPSTVTEALKPPLFQTPQSRSPSPGTPETSDSGSSTTHPKSRQRKDALFPSVSPIKELRETLSPQASPVPAPVVTPRIGESKGIGGRVAGPVIVNIFPESPTPVNGKHIMSVPKTSTATPATPYLYYQPGLHAKAGPLPPPPISVFNIDPNAPPPPRPPRHQPLKKKGDMEAVKQALALPPSVAAALKTRILLTEPKKESGAITSTNSPPSEAVKELAPTLSPLQPAASESRPEEPKSRPNTSSQGKKESELPETPAHVREGAFPPSRVCTTDLNCTVSPDQTVVPLPRHESMDDLVATVGHAIDDMGIIRSSDVPPPTVLEPLRRNENRGNRSGLDIRRISLTPTPPLDDDGSVENERGPEVLPPLPAKNEHQSPDERVRSALSIKRFSSLPRTPSPMSLNQPSGGSKSSSRTPSPSLVVHRPVRRVLPPVQKIKSTWPPAMHFADVIVKKNALDRSVGYAQKINELYMYDCGLGDWIVETRYKAANPPKRTPVRTSVRVPSTHSPRTQTRNISESSTGSEVTFPRRPDAYLATDLSTPPSADSSPPNAPPPLPYPGLASAPRNGSNRASTIIASSSSSSGRSLTSPTSSNKSPGSFFASLGRKTSLKKDKSLVSMAPVIGRVLSKSPPRPVTIPNSPSVPGGPRAPPNRMQRSQTIVISPQSPSNGPGHHRSSTVVIQRPSQLSGRNTFSERGSPTDPDDFARQVDKLAALLPKADKTVLAGYLRRAGQDILAIGQYLEDEKNGSLRYD
ncbi:hypothetical protein DEU56DRAFT_879707 [Suillus clintonianus]|uniref:uncharacterized protein n=1 Tax=Suillus clintonianus TaxID=1904413 RepID=UPI001B867E94|nr:uncharacterized protein DEU56DRAFT_879707 [Suillus clintonianus]KAG2152903.1 hypothetical protein DEU56DRAFT_879707 [Suillus clintonianus]